MDYSKVNKVKEILEKQLNIKIYEEQIKASLELVKGSFIEVKTGEGKSIINVISSYLLMENHKKIYIVSVNDYLSERDYLKFKETFKELGLTVSLNKDNGNKKEVYSSDIIYTSSYELIFDYLKYRIGISDVEINLDGAIIDEADFILIDNATSQFTVSNDILCTDTPSELYHIAKKIVSLFNVGVIGNNYLGKIENNYDSIVDKYKKISYITENGIKKIEKILKIDDLFLITGLYEAINNTIKANYLYQKDVDYIIRDNKIILICKANGRLTINSKFENGLQLALEIKEKVQVTYWNKSSIEISYQIFYNKFKCIYGLSGTLKDSEVELKEIYDKNIKVIKRHFKNNRKDKEDIILKRKNEKKEWLENYIKTIENPVLIISENDKDSIDIYRFLKLRSNKDIKILNSYNYEKCEKSIIERYWGRNTVTISTPLSSRGVDIKISDEINEIGGLEVISLTRFENRRIDEQVKGRTGRQGKNGSSQFIISLEDDVFNSLYIQEREYYLAMNDKAFFSKKNQKKLRNLIYKCQKQYSLNLSKLRLKNYTLEELFTIQQESIEAELITNKNKLIESIENFILEELKEIKEKGIECLFLEEEIKIDTDIIKLSKNISGKIDKSLSIIDNKFFYQVLKKIVTTSIFEEFKEYKEKSLQYIGVLNIDEMKNIYKFINYNNELFKVYKKSVYYTFLMYLTNIQIGSEKNESNYI